MKIVFILVSLIYSTFAKEIVLKTDGPYKLLSNVHLVDGIKYKKKGYQALIEIPAGTIQKWEVDHTTGHLEWEFKNKKPRKVQFLGYPGNYGYIPQTILEKDDGGDGDPLDVIVLGENAPRGTVQEIRILGAAKFLDEGEQDDKIIAVSLKGPFKNLKSLEQMMLEFPGSIQIVRYWFEGYDSGKMQFIGYMKREEAKALVEKAHIIWRKQKNDH